MNESLNKFFGILPFVIWYATLNVFTWMMLIIINFNKGVSGFETGIIVSIMAFLSLFSLWLMLKQVVKEAKLK